MKKGNEFNKWLPVVLTGTEMVERARAVGQKSKDLDELILEKAAVTKDYAERIKKLTGELGSLNKVLRTGEEYRHVACIEKRDLKNRKILTIRLDTGELLEERDIRGSDLQDELPIEEEAADPEESPEKPRGRKKKEERVQTWGTPNGNL